MIRNIRKKLIEFRSMRSLSNNYRHTLNFLRQFTPHQVDYPG